MDSYFIHQNDPFGTKTDFLAHYGMPRRSGRYPWGSGDHPFQNSDDFLSRIEEYKKDGISDDEIRKQMGMSIATYKKQKALAQDFRRLDKVDRAQGLRDKGFTLDEIAEKMGLPGDSSVRTLLDVNSKAKTEEAMNTFKFLADQVDKKGMIEVGKGVEKGLGISRTKFDQALELMRLYDYEVYGGRINQLTNPGKKTTITVACPPGTEHKEMFNLEDVHFVDDFVSHDDGKTFDKAFVYPKSMDKNRLGVVYREDGGLEKDGLVEVRRGVDDVSLGKSNYAQVRILVDGTHYVKGMAVYSDDLPDGIDVRVNSNKPKGTPIFGPDSEHSVLKPIKKKDPNNPFGSLIKEGGQSYYIDKDGKKQLSLINKRAEEGDWGDWADKLPSQFLSKQNLPLIRSQLKFTEDLRKEQYNDILKVKNPTLRRQMLMEFADDCDAAAVHLKAAGLPRQKYQVILPVPDLKDNEVYAPNYKDGEKVILVRYPHGGTFEIPYLTVNNKNAAAKKVMGKNPQDAIGINNKVAGKLSGADFDGDTVMVIPCSKDHSKKFAYRSTLKDLENFDPSMEYPYRPGMKEMKDTQKQMGVISNLITDMTLKGAGDEELACAVRHSMVVIDAEKHHLDYKRSEQENHIAALKDKWQGHVDPDGVRRHGASTLISRAKKEKDVERRVGSPKINDPSKPYYDPSRPVGALLYKTEHQTYFSKDETVAKAKDMYAQGYSKEEIAKAVGKKRVSSVDTLLNKPTWVENVRPTKSTMMAETDDAMTLSSGTTQERYYGKYANYLKNLANQSRMDSTKVQDIPYSKEARKECKKDYDDLLSEVNKSLANQPRENHAQILGGAELKAITKENPDLLLKGHGKELKKIKDQCLKRARQATGASRHEIYITDSQWDAIQKGAFTKTQLKDVFRYANKDRLNDLAFPKDDYKMSASRRNMIVRMVNEGYQKEKIANRFNISISTINNIVNKGDDNHD